VVAKKAVSQQQSEGDVSAATSPSPDEVFSWSPPDGGDPIVLPKAATVVKPGKAIGFFLKLNKLANNLPGQIGFLLDQAGVPEDVQYRVADLEDDQITALVAAWTDEMRTTPGES